MADVFVQPAFISAFQDSGDTTKFGPTAWNAPRLFAGGITGDRLMRDTASATGASWTSTDVINVQDYGAVGNGVADDRAAIQAAIDALPAAGGTVYFPAGTYLCSNTITLRAGVTVQGASKDSVNLAFSHATTDGLASAADPDWLRVSDVTLSSTNAASTGWAIRPSATVRHLNLQNVEVSDFLCGISVPSSISGVLSNIRLNGRGKAVVGGIGIQLTGANGMVVLGAYVNNYELGMSLVGASICIVNPSLEANATGAQINGVVTVVAPWTNESGGSANTLDFDFLSGALLVGYGSSSWNCQYASATVKRRVVIIPSSNDRAAAAVANVGGPAGIKLGSVLVRTDEITVDDGLVIERGGLDATTHVFAGGSFAVPGNIRYIEADATGGSFTITLPTITADELADLTLLALVGSRITLKRIDGSVNQVDLAPGGADTIDTSAATKTVGAVGATGQYGTVTVLAIAATKWRIVELTRVP